MLSCFVKLIKWTFFRSLAPHPPRPAAAHDGPRHLLSQENGQPVNQMLDSDSPRHLLSQDNIQPVSQILEHHSMGATGDSDSKGNSQQASQMFEQQPTRNLEVNAHQQPAGETNELLGREKQARWEKWTIQKHSMIIIIPLP